MTDHERKWVLAVATKTDLEVSFHVSSMDDRVKLIGRHSSSVEVNRADQCCLFV